MLAHGIRVKERTCDCHAEEKNDNVVRGEMDGVMYTRRKMLDSVESCIFNIGRSQLLQCDLGRNSNRKFLTIATYRRCKDSIFLSCGLGITLKCSRDDR